MPTPAHAAAGDGRMGAVVIRRLSIVKIRDLDFGTIALSPASQTATVTLTAADTPVVTSSHATVTPQPGTARTAWFKTYGGPLQTLIVNRGPLPVLSNGAGATMNVTGLTLNGPTTRFLNGAGEVDLIVGGSLRVNANQAPGNYTGTFRIIVTYI